MSPIQKIVYVCLNTIARIALRIYFRKITIIDRENIAQNCPTIIAPNHPNTMIDPVLMATIAPGWIHFLANYGLFKYPLTNFLMSKVLFSIPVKRPKDVAPGERVNNLATIKICSQVLANNGTIFMGPEATSYSYRRIRPLKDGIARIALTAARGQKFKSGIVIQPMGTNYSAPNNFRSEIILRAGEPIYLDQYKDEYKKDKSATAEKVMTELRQKLEALSIHTADEIEGQFLEWMDIIAKSEGVFDSFSEQLSFDQKVLKSIRELRKNKASRFEQIWQAAYQYFSLLEKEKTKDLYVLHHAQNTIPNHLALLLAMPIFMIASVLHVHWFIPDWVFGKLNLYSSYATMVKVLTGILIIPIFSLLTFWILNCYFSLTISLLIFIGISILGMCIIPIKKYIAAYWNRRNYSMSKQQENLQKYRNSLVRKLKEEGLFSTN